ncbi:unnamed protein product [Protopolystoma xenopodis]|uniref:Uncharacterized protein n=1 Tax=Protopolystoma xenopodis TaxID=117903 RepID=A0A448WBI4_9PLAT|nr:unnamed protein product [Protopolystoma xenopodis]
MRLEVEQLFSATIPTTVLALTRPNSHEFILNEGGGASLVGFTLGAPNGDRKPDRVSASTSLQVDPNGPSAHLFT